MKPALHSRSLIRRCLVFVFVLSLISPASAKWKEQVLYSFQGGTDGATPTGGVVFDKSGNLYGATMDGGATNCSPMAACGTVYQLSPPTKKGGNWAETVLRVFQGKAFNDGEFPQGGVIADAAGNIYGTTGYGGTGGCVLLGITGGCGTVYEMSPPQNKGGAWTYTILYSFQGGNDGYLPNGDLVFDSAGNLYGATEFGGGKGTTCDPGYYQYCGTVFELSPPKQKGGAWTEQVLHSFANGTDGANPDGGLIFDKKGAIYGTTVAGGNQSCRAAGSVGCGTVFKLTPSKTGGVWAEKLLYRFDGHDGANPLGGVISDTKGALYGTAQGGSNNEGDGVAFRLRVVDGVRWKETVLHVFSRNDSGGADPMAGLVLDAHGHLYGTASWSHISSGDVFEMKPPSRKGEAWVLSVLYGFLGPPDGATPSANLIFDKLGNLYSTTTEGGTGTCGSFGCGTVFEVFPK
jgi:hypothetical protein